MQTQQQPQATGQQESLQYGMVYNNSYPGLNMLNNSSGVLNMQNQQLLTLSMPQPQPQPPAEEPLYVNAKQYHRILKRRDARARWEAQYKNARKDKVDIYFIFFHCNPFEWILESTHLSASLPGRIHS